MSIKYISVSHPLIITINMWLLVAPFKLKLMIFFRKIDLGVTKYHRMNVYDKMVTCGGVSRSAEPPSPPIFSKKIVVVAEIAKILKISESSPPIRNKRRRCSEIFSKFLNRRRR